MDGHYRVYESLGMDKVDKGIYLKWITQNDVTFSQEEKAII